MISKNSLRNIITRVPRHNSIFFVSGFLAMLALTFFLQSTYASGSQVCPPIPNYAGRAIQSCKDIIITGGWQGKMTTRVVTGNALSELGWNWWTDTRFCGGYEVANGIGWYSGGAYLAYNSKAISATSSNHALNDPFCDEDIHEARVAGKHIWKQPGYLDRTFEWEDWEGLP